MRMLLAGNDKQSQIKAERASLCEAGFTLVEMMMSMLIIGLMTGVVVLNLPSGDDPAVEQGKLLVSRLRIAAQTSMIENTPVGIEFNEDGYSAVRFIGGEWETVESFTYELEQPLVLELTQNGAKIDLDAARKTGVPVIRYDATGLATPFELEVDAFGLTMFFDGKSDGSVEFKSEGRG